MATRRGRFDPDRTLEDIRDHRLGSLERAYGAGLELAVFDVIDICRRDAIPLPNWAADAISAQLQELHSGAKRRNRRKGRASSAVSRYRQDLIHYDRYEAVERIKEHRETSWAEYQDALKDPRLTDEERERVKRYAPFDPGKGSDVLYERAAESLVKSPAFASGEAIRSSYRLVQRLMKDRAKRGRLHILSYKTRQRFGILWL